MASTNIRDMIDRPDHPMLKRAFNEIIEIVCHSDSNGMAPVDAWFKRLIEETVPHGKCIRGMLLLSTYQMVETSSNTESLELATIAFWLIEMSQALALILDDFVDRAQTRRGRVCWHLRDDVGSMALYDVFLLEQGIYEVMRRRFKNHRHYVDFLELTHEIALITIKGQSLDMLAERGRLSSEEVYKELINAKTALYTFYLPVRFGLLLAHKDDFALHMKVREFSLKIGSIFQQQDDFLDCYGDPSATGKIGTDITDGKCTWFYVTAMKLADESQRKVLEENYGQGKPGKIVRIG
ncbi:farnesyl pyrophosphate synthase-like isoform X2 [Varroa jacobsoni]|uniref:farnesyl pyrophosphate synthase-like isoform X2 n=1 Tax=Varroa jacobsoni TaxID=62625 RepID=UPI000BF5779E|nr:farnesyl pyrophosphate synthase-like isoform X2 [Varroa jacobsoni]